MPVDYSKYPKNWKRISEYIRFERANHQCENCGVDNYAVGYRNVRGEFVPASGSIVLDMIGQGKVYPSLESFIFNQSRYVLAFTCSYLFLNMEEVQIWVEDIMEKSSHGCLYDSEQQDCLGYPESQKESYERFGNDLKALYEKGLLDKYIEIRLPLDYEKEEEILIIDVSRLKILFDEHLNR